MAFRSAGSARGFVARARRSDERWTTLPSRSLNLCLGQCALAALLTIPSTAAQFRPEPAAPVGPPATHAPAPWERAVRGGYENRGIAQIEKLGQRWVLNVHCDGTHATYLDDARVDLARYARGYVSVRYHYADHTVSDPKCFRAPCPPVLERRIVLDRIKTRSVSPERARASARRCDP
jgi:hypothetical protein